MAQAYRKSKIEKFYNDVKWEHDYTREQIKKYPDIQLQLTAELRAYERILRKMEDEFDLKAL